MSSASLAVDNAHPTSGQTVTATYTVTGLSPIQGTLQGSVTVDGVPTPVTVTMGDSVTYAVPTISGLTFQATGKPNVFTAVCP